MQNRCHTITTYTGWNFYAYLYSKPFTGTKNERQNSSCKFSPISELLYKAIVHPEYSNREARTQSQPLIYVISSEKLSHSDWSRKSDALLLLPSSSLPCSKFRLLPAVHGKAVDAQHCERNLTVIISKMGKAKKHPSRSVKHADGASAWRLSAPAKTAAPSTGGSEACVGSECLSMS